MNPMISKPQSAQSNTFSYRPYEVLPYSLPYPREILQLYVLIYILLSPLTGTLSVQSFTADSATCSCMCFFDFKLALFFPLTWSRFELFWNVIYLIITQVLLNRMTWLTWKTKFWNGFVFIWVRIIWLVTHICQLSCIMHESHTCRLKTLISHIKDNFSHLTYKSG